MQKRWKVLTASEEAVQQLQQSLKIFARNWISFMIRG
jgi:hypothetical protein